MTAKKVALWLMVAAGAWGQAPEDGYRGELVKFPGAWAFRIPSTTVILTTDEELEAMAADPERVLNLATGLKPNHTSLRMVCERAQARGERTIKIAFDHFFRQYRPGQDRPRRLTPDSAEYIEKIAAVGRFAERYGLGLELSLLSPLEVGRAYARQTGEAGIWMQYRKGLRDPKSGAFSVEFWQHRRWANNKGVIELKPGRVRVFAFREKSVGGTPYRVVDPAWIEEIREGIEVEHYEGILRKTGDFTARRVRVHGRGPTQQTDLDRVLVVAEYETPEMDYFSAKALPFLNELVDRYLGAGVKLNGLYSDEMHIQGDWGYFGHHDHGQFTLRYASEGLRRRYAELYGNEYLDFAKYLVYFTYGQEDAAADLTPRLGIQHVFGASPEAIRKTALFRSRYYRLLQDQVVDLFTAAKRHAEMKTGRRLEARAHATWAQSPTIDYWEAGRRNRNTLMYEYTSNFVWSNTVHQAATACADYFKWGDFLTGNGNDHAEGGWLDRNYYGLALGASTGVLNEVPNSYAAHWGMPAEVDERRDALVAAYGTNAEPFYGAVENMEHRSVDVLMLYPLDLVAVEERFGSWMTQYGYANLITATKLLERGRVVAGGVEVAGRRYTTLVATFEPFPAPRLLALMREFAAQGGRLIWSGPPPVLTSEGGDALNTWRELFGVDYTPAEDEGVLAAGVEVRFEGELAGVAPQTVLTDLLPDHLYAVTPRTGTAVAARAKRWVVATHRALAGGGSATYLGYRPRDDQSRSLGYETRNWFEVLLALGAYAGEDNPERISRTKDVLATRFPNGAVALAPHLRWMEESWPGGFSRDAQADRKVMAENPPPSDRLKVEGLKVAGHTVGYEGKGAVAFRAGAKGELEAFAGRGSREITVDGRRTVFADAVMEQVGWAPVSAERRVEGGAVAEIRVRGAGRVRIPAAGWPAECELVAEGAKPGSRGQRVAARRESEALVFEVTPEVSGRTVYVVARKP